MAQLVEQRIRNAQAVGSSPTSSSKKPVLRNRFFYPGRQARHIITHSVYIIAEGVYHHSSVRYLSTRYYTKGILMIFISYEMMICNALH